MNEFIIEVDVLKADGVTLLERVNLPARYSDYVAAIVVAYKGSRQQAQGNHHEGFYITIF